MSPAASHIPTTEEALTALCKVIADIAGAARVIAVEVKADLRVRPLAANDGPLPPAFDLARSGLVDAAWDGQPRAVKDFRLPTALYHANLAQNVMFLPVPLDHAPQSGVLLLWSQEGRALSPVLCAQLALSAAPLMETRTIRAQEQRLETQFSDLFDTVPSAIVMTDASGQSGFINHRAGALLGCAAGPHAGRDLARMMGQLRARCDNAEALDALYSGLLADPHFAAQTVWTLDDRHYAVDTHPLRNDGLFGRVWLFTDVTGDMRMAEELRRLAASDPLTGIPNRRHFEERSAQIAAARDRAGRAIGILMLDVDHFKAINDRYGHPAGDEVLKVVVQRCGAALGQGDLLARFGGEEFVALLSVATPAEAAQAAEALRAIVAARPVTVEGHDIPVTVSIGVAVDEVTEGAGTVLVQELVARADAALYRAKRGGRNRVATACDA